MSFYMRVLSRAFKLCDDDPQLDGREAFKMALDAETLENPMENP